MKKLLGILSLLIITMSLVACGGGQNDDVDTVEDNQEETVIHNDISQPISDIEMETMKTVNYMYEQGTITKEQNRQGVKRVFDTTEQVKEDIQKDPRYEDIIDKLDKEQLDEVELNSFLTLYLQRIQEAGEVQ